MLETQNLQKSSSPETEVSSSVSIEAPKATIYLDRQEAIKDFDAETAIQNKPQHVLSAEVASLVSNAKVLMRHKEEALALNLLRTASNKDSKNPLILNLIADCLEICLRSEEALKVRLALVEVDNGFESVQKLATAYYKLGQDGEALKRYFEALSLLTEETSSLFEVYKNMGNILVRQTDYEGAEEYYNKAYTLNPQSDTLLVNFGTLEVQREDFDKSLYCFRQAVEINKNNDKAWIGLAMVHAQFGDLELARANVETAIDINPRNRTAIQLLANWALRDKCPYLAIEVLENYLAQVESDEDMSLVLINLFCANSQIVEAQLECERVLLWNPFNAEVASLKIKLNQLSKNS